MLDSIRLAAFAKVNLYLRVLGRRPDGYHELRTIFQTISLHDTLQLSLSRRSGIRLSVRDLGSKDQQPLSAGPENLVYRAIDALACALNFRGGVEARLEKRIPIARGLGGGSSDAAAALAGFLRLTKDKIPLDRLLCIAASLGADVPFFLFGGRALAVNRGDEIYPLPDASRRTILIVSPRAIAVSTKDAYQWLAEGLTNSDQARNIWEFCALCWSGRGRVANDFERPVFRRHPRLAEIRERLLQHGAVEAALAGSGSAVFGIYRNPAQARRTAREFPEDSVFVVNTVSRQQYRRALGLERNLASGLPANKA